MAAKNKAPSARGLFRAMGKTSAPVEMLDVDTGEIVRIENGLPREAHDFYPTPPEPTRAFLQAESAFIREHQCVVWEPCAGDGAMAREISGAGHACFASDLIDRGCGAHIADFYSFTDVPWHAIVTNPPFADCNGSSPFICHALDVLQVDYLALLLPSNWWGAAERAALWRGHTPSIVYGMRWRISFQTETCGQGGPVDFARAVATRDEALACAVNDLEGRLVPLCETSRLAKAALAWARGLAA